jgi:hypothetical protein
VAAVFSANGNHQISGLDHASDSFQHNQFDDVNVAVPSEKMGDSGKLAFIKVRLSNWLNLVTFEDTAYLTPADANVDITELLWAITVNVRNQAIEIILEFDCKLLSGKALLGTERVGGNAQRVFRCTRVQQASIVSRAIVFNLTVLRGSIDDESVDLVYLDPPFNSQATYNVLFKSTSGERSRAQIEAFDDTWHWGDEAELAFDGVMTSGNSDAAEMLRSMRSFLKENDMMAYLSMMAVRLLELHRVLKPTGSLYLHCDPTASHYLRILIDAVFGASNFRSELIWKRTSAQSAADRWGNVHDTIFFYSKSGEYTWNELLLPHTGEYSSRYKNVDQHGELWADDNLTGPGIRHGDSGANWRGYDPTVKGVHWKVNLKTVGRLIGIANTRELSTTQKLDVLDKLHPLAEVA